jgi:hypothetical protein
MAQKPNTAPPTIEVVREFDGLSFGPTTLYVTFSDLAGSPIQQYPEPWEARLDLALMEQGWRAPSQQNEAVRIELALKHLFSSAESRFGDGFFSSVLGKFVAQSAFAKAEAVKQLLSLIREPAPSKDSQFVGDCEQMIVNALGIAAKLLKDKLRYSLDEAEAILVDAMAKYLDERFSITAGINLGLYKR